MVVSKAQAYWGAEQPVIEVILPLLCGTFLTYHTGCGSEGFVHAQGGGFAWRAFEVF